MAKNKQWKQAIIEVLRQSEEPMSRTDIAEQIVSRGLREDVGRTPANTVVSYISTSLKDEAQKSPFVRVGRGEYWLRELFERTSTPETQQERTDLEEDTSLINAFGMYWDRAKINWKKTVPCMLGIEQSGAKPIDFSGQVGVYILYDNYRPIYVGRTTNDRLGKRLREHHLMSRFRGRWNRFSWFGICGVQDNGKLDSATIPSGPDQIVIAMESLLIETVEPVQNRRRGDGFSAVEYLQVDDPGLETEKIDQEIIKRLLERE